MHAFALISEKISDEQLVELCGELWAFSEAVLQAARQDAAVNGLVGAPAGPSGQGEDVVLGV